MAWRMSDFDHTVPEQKGTAGKPRVKGHVLVVDDLPLNLDIGSALLSHAGCTVDVADSGYAAIAKARTTQYDLVLMDIHMPEMDGLETTRLLRKEGPGPDVLPIIAWTASTQSQDLKRFADAGMNGNLEKPLPRGALLGLLERWLPRDRSASPAFDAERAARLRAALPDAAAWDAAVAAVAETGATVLPALTAAVEGERLADVREHAATLKRASEQIGAARLADWCDDLDWAASGARTALCRRLLTPLRAELDALPGNAAAFRTT